MANCNHLFQTFNQEISITESKKTSLIKSRDELRNRIRKYFKENHPEYDPKFYIQGSYKMKTTIRTKDDICDLDDGVYFFKKPDVAGTTLQGWIKEACSGYTSTPPEHRKKCIRNIFASDYEIDMPIYYKIDGLEYKLAVKNEEWQDSDPKAMVSWFNDKKDNKGVLVKIVKYLKCWGDNKRNKMPSGLALSILASNAKEKIVFNENRDDISLRDTLKEIKKALDTKFECIVPAVPNDDLFANYDETRKNNFLDALKSFIENADEAINEKNQLKASKSWQKHLGDRFPDGEDKDDEDDKEKYASLFSVAKKNNPWCF